MDAAGIEESLDEGFGLGPSQHVVRPWLFPTLEAALARVGHAARSMWRASMPPVMPYIVVLLAAFEEPAAAGPAGNCGRGRAAFSAVRTTSCALGSAILAIRRRGLDVLYLGANVPVSSWEAAVRSREARAAVLSVVTPEDREAAVAVAERLLGLDPAPLVCAGGASAARLAGRVHTLPSSIGAAAEELDDLAHRIEE